MVAAEKRRKELAGNSDLVDKKDRGPLKESSSEAKVLELDRGDILSVLGNIKV